MSFRISARGVPNFRYPERANQIEGSDFEIASVLSIIYSLDPTRMGVISAAHDYFSSSGEYTELTNNLAQTRMVGALNDAINFLAISPGARNGSISIAAFDASRILRPQRSSFVVYRSFIGSTPGANFIRLISQTLIDTGMDNWGVLRALALVLSRYSDHLGESDTSPFISIELHKE
jgi:hypothetical protein